jgi:hypothetical protein
LINATDGVLRVKDKKLTKDEQKKADNITQFILDCGNNENFWKGDTMESGLLVR